MSVKTKNKAIDRPFHIIDVNNTKSLIGIKSCQDLNIFTINTVESDHKNIANFILKQYDDIFKGLGKADGEYTIKLSDDAKPTIHPPRKVPLTILLKLKETLDHLEMADVVSKLDHPTEWINSLVIVEKKGGLLKLCFVDRKDLNEHILRDFKAIPSPEEISCKLETKNILLLLICEIVIGTLC